MDFVSCLPVLSSDEEVELVLCKATFDNRECVNLEKLQSLRITELMVSEGSDIHIIQDFTAGTIHCFGNADCNAAWYALINILSGHSFHSENSMDLEGSIWKCDLRDEPWKLVWELDLHGIIKKNAEVILNSSHGREVDLFKMSLKLFNDYCAANDAIHGLEQREKAIERELDHERQKLQGFNEIISQRDMKTRAMVLELLNEKKEKIRELQRRLEENKGSDEVSDDRLINAFVNKPVSRMNSPHKRRSTTPILQSAPKRPTITAVKKEEDDFDDFANQDFAFMGINRPLSSSPAKLEPTGTPELPTSKIGVTTGDTPSEESNFEEPPPNNALSEQEVPSLTLPKAECSAAPRRQSSEDLTSTEGEDETETETEAGIDHEIDSA